MDLEGIREHVLYQKSLCFETRALDGDLRVLRRQLAAASGLPPEEMSRLAEFVDFGLFPRPRQFKIAFLSAEKQIEVLYVGTNRQSAARGVSY